MQASVIANWHNFEVINVAIRPIAILVMDAHTVRNSSAVLNPDSSV
jgi:hypothetical protein